MSSPVHDISRLSTGERIWFAATGLAFAYAKAVGTSMSLASQGALEAFRSFVNANRLQLTTAMTAGGFRAQADLIPDAMPVSGAYSVDDGVAIKALAEAYFAAALSGSNFTSAATLGRWWWSDLQLRLGDTDDIVQVFLSALTGGPEMDASSRLTREASNIVNGTVNVGVGWDLSDEAAGRTSSQAARVLAAAVAEATGATPGDAEAIPLPAMEITGRAPARETIPPWAVAVGAVGFGTLGLGLVYVLGKKKRWWR